MKIINWKFFLLFTVFFNQAVFGKSLSVSKDGFLLVDRQKISGEKFLKRLRQAEFKNEVGSMYQANPSDLGKILKSKKFIKHTDLELIAAALQSSYMSDVVNRDLSKEINQDCSSKVAEYEPTHVIIPSKSLLTVSVGTSDEFWAKAFKLPNYTPEAIAWHWMSAQPTRVQIDSLDDLGSRMKFKVTGIIAGSHTNVRVGKNSGRGGPGDPDRPGATDPPLTHSVDAVDVNVLVDNPVGPSDPPPTDPAPKPAFLKASIDKDTVKLEETFSITARYYDKSGNELPPVNTDFPTISGGTRIEAGLFYAKYRLTKVEWTSPETLELIK